LTLLPAISAEEDLRTQHRLPVADAADAYLDQRRVEQVGSMAGDFMLAPTRASGAAAVVAGSQAEITPASGACVSSARY